MTIDTFQDSAWISLSPSITTVRSFYFFEKTTLEVQINTFVTVNKQKALLGLRYDFNDAMVQWFSSNILKFNSSVIHAETNAQKDYPVNSLVSFKASTPNSPTLLELKSTVGQDIPAAELKSGLIHFIVDPTRNTSFFIHKNKLLESNWRYWSYSNFKKLHVEAFQTDYLKQIGLPSIGALLSASPAEYCQVEVGRCFVATHEADYIL